MKGDKVWGVTRAEKLWVKLQTGNAFTSGIQDARKRLRIPPQGFETDEAAKWLASRKPDQLDRFNQQLASFLEKLQLPMNIWWIRRAADHILGVLTSVMLPDRPGDPFVEIGETGPRASFRDVRIYGGASQDDVLGFIRVNWKQHIEPHQPFGSAKNIRARFKYSHKRDEPLMKYGSISLKELETAAGIRRPRWILVSALMKQKGWDISPENAERTFYRLKKSKR